MADELNTQMSESARAFLEDETALIAQEQQEPVAVFDRGDRGEGVMELQQRLADQGFDVGDVDGIYGGKTQAAALEYQRRAGNLNQTGVFDGATYNALMTREPMDFGTTLSSDQVRVPTQEYERIDPNTMIPRLFNDLKTDFNLSDVGAAAIIGNLMVETGNFRSLQEISPLVEGSRGGYGIAQWTGPRRVAYESWAEQNGLPLDSYEANYGFLKEELTNRQAGSIESMGRNTITRLREIEDLDAASLAVRKGYLRPDPRYAHQDRRDASTRSVYEQMTAQ
jgi:peptidoglycan hydrolase-like protein with peptidoglycan-binding domain